MYILGLYRVGITPNLEDWQAIYQENISGTESLGIPDTITGWSFRPNRQSPTLKINGQGFRDNEDFVEEKEAGVIRIGLFGNSFMLSAEVGDSQTLAFYLENTLIEKGYNAEVYNFAVSAHGNDQNYLTWKHKAQKYDLDVVVAGVHELAFWVNQNIFLYNLSPETGVSHMTKPKAVLENNQLQWVNFPPVPPENMVNDIILNYENQPFYQYEHFNENRRVGEKWFESLYLYQIWNYLDRVKKLDIQQFSEGQILTDSIFRIFKREVEATGSQFVLLELPTFSELLQVKLYGKIRHQTYLNTISENQNYFESAPLLAPADNLLPYFEEGFHYSGRASKIIIESFTEYLIENGLLK